MKYKIEISKELEELIPLFRQETEKNLHLLRQAIENRDIETIKFISHKMKGASGSYGFEKISQWAKQIEEISKTTKSIEEIKKIFEELSEYYNNTEVIFVDKPL
ncbi:MAG: hypothetical protein KatS3mg129_1259 [Leptospiraceae bacterium]|nr:MAG: hypothetical protein KatS3mg129_1259 [Leptospiraceae bacterium]